MQIAIIPARGGSKRIPRKNVKPFCGQPMISLPIRAALESGLFDEVIVSTDDDDIAEAALAAGASAPFRRPAELADDVSPARDAINHAIAEAEKLRGRPARTICAIYAASPLLEAEDLIAARALLQASSNNWFVFAAASYAHPVERAMRRAATGGVEMLHPEHARTRSQDLVEAFHDAGQFYLGTREAFMGGHPMFSPRSVPYLLPRERAVDIDTPEDWAFAERLFGLRASRRTGPGG